MPRAGGLAIHRELRVPPGGGAAMEQWTLGVEASPVEGDGPAAIAADATVAVITIPAGQPVGLAGALLVTRATELGLQLMVQEGE